MPDRRLAAVMVTDMVGFTSLMGADQDHAVRLLNQAHDLLKSIVTAHGGEWLEDAGDRSLTAFPSAINAVECALEVQAGLREESELRLRIGIDVGDILVSGGHVYGDVVNTASFIERLADPGGLVITKAVYEAVRKKVTLNVVDLGDKLLKHADRSVRLYALTGTAQKHQVINLFSALMARRVPHITGAYLAASWAVVEVADWLAGQGAISRLWVYGILAGLIALIPSVVLVTYSHGAHGRDRLTRAEKTGVPLNLVLAAFVVAYVVQSVEVSESWSPIEPASVAVLPFVSMSDDQENDYFSHGLSEEVIHALAKVPGLYVASRSSSFMFERSGEDPRVIARRLRVATVLEGSVQRWGNSVKVTAQLINGMNNYHIWSETYERELDDVFEIQEDIAATVAIELVGVLKPDVFQTFADARADSLDVFDFYARGLTYLRQPPTEESLASARRLFDRALAEDPDYAQAHAAICETALQEYLLYRSPSLIDTAESSCLEALALDDGARDVRIALAELYRATGRLTQSEATYRELMRRRVSPRALTGLAKTLAARGDNVAAEAAFLEAIDVEPGNWHHRMDYGEFLYRRGRYEDALQSLRQVVELSPDNARAYLLMGACHDYLGDTEQSLRDTMKSIELAPTRAAYRDLGLTHYYLGDYGRAAAAFETAIELGPEDHYSWSSLAHAYSRLDGRGAEERAAWARAIESAEAVLARNPRDYTTLSRLAVYNVMTGDRDKGVQRIRTAVGDGGHLAEVHYNDAVVHMQLGETEAAIGALENALELGFSARLVARDPGFAKLRGNERLEQAIADKLEEQ